MNHLYDMYMSTILISEFITSQALESLSAKHKVVFEPELHKNPEKLIAAVQNTDALIVRNQTKVDSELLLNAPHLKVVGRLGVGLENIDLGVCAARNIKVIPATGANADSVAEYVIGSAITLIRGLIPATYACYKGEWPRQSFVEYREASKKILGIVGFGSIGKILAEKAHAFGFQCIAHDPLITTPVVSLVNGSVPILPLNQLLSQSDVISLHLPLIPQTKDLFNGVLLDQIKRGACLINTARGGILDEYALADRLKSGHLLGAAIDVFSSEPARDLSHFWGIQNLILTPHIAGVTRESNERVSQMIADEILEFLEA